MAEQRNPVEMTEEEIAEATGEALPEAMDTDEVPSAPVEDPAPAR
jgi:hypothetical protein